eukprot:TRINITY_DN50278_c0_g1_i1.p1 TRINITY_DN50278_c0_g1~~TRINITY_DN50278_c0_g1_i1.p1  ORF type:complete len:379 (-),score=15.77 TRINITY_DN50278_c0_g1_i1:294-1430(-)
MGVPESLPLQYFNDVCADTCSKLLTYACLAETQVALSDVSYWITSRFEFGGSPNSFSSRLTQSFIVGLFVYGGGFALLFGVSGQDELATFAQIRLLSALYRRIFLMAFSGQAGAASFLANRFTKMRSDLIKASVSTHPKHELGLLIARIAILAFHFADRVSADAEENVGYMLFYCFVAMLPFFASIYLLLHRLIWRLPVRWSVSCGGVHAVAMSDDCTEHDVCGICLENLCVSLDLFSAARLRLNRQARSCLAIGRRMPTFRHSFAALSGAEQRVATLRCGHKFHVECIEASSSNSLHCPICRTPLDSGVDPGLDVLRDIDYRELMHLSLLLEWSTLHVSPFWNYFVIIHIYTNGTIVNGLMSLLNIFGLGVGPFELK